MSLRKEYRVPSPTAASNQAYTPVLNTRASHFILVVYVIFQTRVRVFYWGFQTQEN